MICRNRYFSMFPAAPARSRIPLGGAAPREMSKSPARWIMRLAGDVMIASMLAAGLPILRWQDRRKGRKKFPSPPFTTRDKSTPTPPKAGAPPFGTSALRIGVSKPTDVPAACTIYLRRVIALLFIDSAKSSSTGKPGRVAVTSPGASDIGDLVCQPRQAISLQPNGMPAPQRAGRIILCDPEPFIRPCAGPSP